VVPEIRPGWQLSVGTAAVLALIAGGSLLLRFRWARAVGAFAREFTVVMALLALWQGIGRYVHTRATGAMERAEWIWHVQHVLPFPDEVALQRLVLPVPALVRAANTYYGYAHLNGMAVFLVWLWWRHRAAFPRARFTVVSVTLACFLVQIVPVAPPRLLPQLGFVDTGRLYGQSVYGAFDSGAVNQLSAMPSVHVGWAVIVGWFTWRYARRGWRWIGPVHAVLTVLVVVVTANHWWLDGVVAAVLVAVAVPLSAVVERVPARLVARLKARGSAPPGARTGGAGGAAAGSGVVGETGGRGGTGAEAGLGPIART
jgi:hypothetical protein